MNHHRSYPAFFRRLGATAATTITCGLFTLPAAAASGDSLCHFDASAPLATASSLAIDLPAAGDPAWNVVPATVSPDGPIGEPAAGSLSVAAAILDRPHYAAGDVVTLDIQTGVEGARVTVDFSAVDSTYRAGAERVAELGRGRYRAAYRIDPRNVRPAGDYPLTVAVRLGDRVERRPEAVSVTWLPHGPGLLEAPAGRFLATASRIPAAAQSASSPSAITSARFEPASRSQAALNARAAGTLRLDLASPSPLRPGEADLEIVEEGRDGHWQVPLVPGPAVCGSAGCHASATVELERGGAAPGVSRSGLVLRLTQGGAASGSSFLPNLDFTSPPSNHTHRLEGRLRFRFQKRVQDLFASFGNPNYPQYASVLQTVQARGIAFAKIVLQDGCGHNIAGTTAEDGTYALEWTPVNCGQGTLTVWTLVNSGNRNAAVAKWKHGAIGSVSDLTTAAADYALHSYTRAFDTADAAKSLGGLDLDVDVPEYEIAARAFLLLDRAVAGQTYYRDIPGVGSLPKLNVIYSPGKKPADAPSNWDGQWATYLPSKDPGMIWIPAEPEYGWNTFAILHETAHYFHRHYLRNWDYGRLSEPLANAQAATIGNSIWFDKLSTMESIEAQPNFKNGAFQGAAWQFCDGCNVLDYSYGWTQRVFWDLYDGAESAWGGEPIHDWIPEGQAGTETFAPFDFFDGGGGAGSPDADDHVINEVLMDYVGGGPLGTQSGNYVDRGLTNVDLVDILDGLLCRGLATENQIDTLVNDAMGFGYDFGGPASCP